MLLACSLARRGPTDDGCELRWPAHAYKESSQAALESRQRAARHILSHTFIPFRGELEGLAAKDTDELDTVPGGPGAAGSHQPRSLTPNTAWMGLTQI